MENKIITAGEGGAAKVYPKVSVALLTYNGGDSLCELLKKLKSQNYGGELEIVALDSGSTDQSIEHLEGAGAIVECIPQSQFRFGTARQRIFGRTAGDIIITLSQDAIPLDGDFVTTMTEPMLHDAVDIVTGVNQWEPDRMDYWQRHPIVNHADPFAHWPAEWRDVSCHCLAVTRDAWEKAGFGDGPMCEDKHFAARARTLGLRAASSGRPVVSHVHEYTLRGWTKRSFNEGMGARFTGGAYDIRSLFRDVADTRRWRQYLWGIRRAEIRTVAELVFPLARPAMLWVGYRFGQEYWK